jgi:hypothetical protein
MQAAIGIRHYVSRAGKDVFDDWLSQLPDARAQAKIASGSTGSGRGILATARHCATV